MAGDFSVMLHLSAISKYKLQDKGIQECQA